MLCVSFVTGLWLHGSGPQPRVRPVLVPLGIQSGHGRVQPVVGSQVGPVQVPLGVQSGRDRVQQAIGSMGERLQNSGRNLVERALLLEPWVVTDVVPWIIGSEIAPMEDIQVDGNQRSRKLQSHHRGQVVWNR